MSKLASLHNLCNLNSSNSLLTLKGQVSDSKTFDSINSFLIGLDNSKFINFSDIDLGDIKVKEKDLESSKYFVFDITTKITSDFEEINQKYLKILGSQGLSNRIDILKSFNK